MTMTLATVVMAHRDREQRALDLAYRVGAGLVWDQGLGEWDTGMRAWELGLEAGTTHILVLQDDAVPATSQLGREVLLALQAAKHGQMPLSLYLGRKKPSLWEANVREAVGQAEAGGASFLVASHLLHGVAFALKADWVRPMLDWSAMPQVASMPYDQRIGAYLRRMRSLPTWYTWPSLVDHADIPTLVQHDDDGRLSTQGRVAYRTGVPISSWAAPVSIAQPYGAEP